VYLAHPDRLGKGSLVAAGRALPRGRPRGGRGAQLLHPEPGQAGLVSEKFFADVRDVRPGPTVGMMTGDASVNADAPIICSAPAEIAGQHFGRLAGDGERGGRRPR